MASLTNIAFQGSRRQKHFIRSEYSIVIVYLLQKSWLPPGRSEAEYEKCRGMPCDEYVEVERTLAKINALDLVREGPVDEVG